MDGRWQAIAQLAGEEEGVQDAPRVSGPRFTRAGQRKGLVEAGRIQYNLRQ